MAIKRTKDIDSELAEKWNAEDRDDGDKWEKGDYGKNPKYMRDASPAETAKIEKAVESLGRRRGRPKSEIESKGVFMNLPLELLDAIKLQAKKLNIGYQSYIKIALTQFLKTADAVEENETTPKAKKPAKKTKRKRRA